jgi:FKBP-type peptidyl-prolyl cis-trans isomerase FkpA
MLHKISLVLITSLYSLIATAQFTAPQKTAPPLVANTNIQPTPPSFNYKKLNDNLSFAFIIKKSTTVKPQNGDQISVNMQMTSNNMLLFNSWQTNKGKPAVYGVNEPAFKGDIIEAIKLMTPGDSIVCLVDANALFNNSKNKRPAFIKSGDKIQYFIKLISIKTKEQVQKEQQAEFQKQINEQMAKQKVAAAKQAAIDDKMLTKWFTTKNINPTKAPSGMYYTIKQEGAGEQAAVGDSVQIIYTGTLLDGTKFDSNEDTAFHHVQPYPLILGRGTVINGWEMGIPLLKVGSKATFYIPSGMAYGTQVRPGSAPNPKGIPANSILVFDMELLSSKHPAPQQIPASPKKDSSNIPAATLKQ